MLFEREGRTMSEDVIRIAYDGEALRNGAMDVRDLAPALIALSDLFEETHNVLGGTGTVQLRARSDFQRGSFQVCIEIVQAWPGHVLNIFAGAESSAIANLIEILGFCKTAVCWVAASGATGGGVLAFVRWLQRRPIKRVEIVDENSVRLIIEGDDIVVRKPMAKVLADAGVRNAIWRVLAPLRSNGVESFEVRDKTGEVIHRVDEPELPSYETPLVAPGPTQKVTENTVEQAFTVMTVNFKEGNKWRLFDGESTVSVAIEDESFLERVGRREISFTKDDTLLCKVRRIQTQSAGGDLRTETAVVEVVAHKAAMRQRVFGYAEDEKKKR